MRSRLILGLCCLGLVGPPSACATAAPAEPVATPTLATARPAAADASPYYGRRLVRLEWVGRHALSSADLAAACGWRAGAVVDSVGWMGLAERVAGRYAEDGYLVARLERVEFEDGVDGVAARLHLEEGPRFRLGEVRVHGGGPEADVRAALDLTAGEAWSSRRVDAALKRLVERYHAASRPFTRVHVRRLTTEGDRADLELVVLESDTVWVDSIRVEGLAVTSASLVRQLARSLMGRPYEPVHAERLRRRLLDLGVFAAVEGPRLEAASRRRAVLVYSVEERLPNRAAGALGYQGSGAGAAGVAEIALGNLAGTARQAEFGWQGRGEAGSLFRLAYREPTLPLLGLRAEFALDHELYDTSFVRTRGALELRRASGLGLEWGVGVARERVVTGSVVTSRSQRTEYSVRGGLGLLEEETFRGRPRGARLDVRGAYARTREHRDGEDPIPGGLWTGELTAGLVGGAGAARQFRLELALRARSAAGQVVGTADRFPLGGVATLRGYREEAFRTDRLALLRTEVGFGGGETRPFLFVDHAVFARPAAPSTDAREIRYRVGYGAGLTQRTGAGRLGLVLAWGEGTQPLDAKLHLAFATRF